MVTSNRFDALTEPDLPAPTETLAKPQPTTIESLPVLKAVPKLPSHKRWHYVPSIPDDTRGDRRNDGPKSTTFFKLPPPVEGPNRRSSRASRLTHLFF